MLTAFDGVKRVKWAYVTRRVNRADAARLLGEFENAEAGDVLYAEVMEIGQHSGLQLKTGRRAELYVGDRVALCLGARYAPDYFQSEAVIDGDFAHLVAAGGVAGIVVKSHGRRKTPTLLKVLGRVARADGKPINVRDYALGSVEPGPRPPVIAVFGASMNAGKTTAAASLIHGLSKAGYKVGACKVTGTGACGDNNKYRDAGAHALFDFTDLGFATTFGVETEKVTQIASDLIGHLAQCGATAIVMEIADGVLQRETAALMNDPAFIRMIDATIFAAPDALSVINGVNILRDAGHSILGVSGVITRSPMSCEEVLQVIDTPVMTKQALGDGATMAAMLDAAGLASADLAMAKSMNGAVAAAA
jgi:hypothetical protein